MAKDTTKSTSRAHALKQSMRQRRSISGLVMRAEDEGVDLPRLVWALAIGLAMVVMCGGLAIWTRERPLVAVGRVMDTTRTVRVPLNLPDIAATEAARDSARQRTPWVYVAETGALDEIESSIRNLPRTLASVQSVDQLEPAIRDQFRLTPEQVSAVRSETTDPRAIQGWDARVALLMGQLRLRPLLDATTWQRSTQEGLHREVRLRLGGDVKAVNRSELVNVEDAAKLAEVAEIMARDAGFTGAARQVVVNRLTSGPRTTFRLDAAATAAAKEEAAASVPAVFQNSPVGQVIFRRGEALTGAQFDLFRAEVRAFTLSEDGWMVWLRRAGVLGMVTAVTLALAGYVGLFCARIRGNAARMTALAGLFVLTLAIACIGTASDPALVAVTGVAPTVLVAIVLCIAYDQRVALAFGTLHGVLVCLALDRGVGAYATVIAGVGAAVVMLGDVRDRGTIFRMSLGVAVALAAATALVGMMERPMVVRALRETAIDSGLAAGGALVVGAFTLFMLPAVERAFEITTGMTLVELRDPKHPLLRELQQRAPGTYNHALNVAAIAEAAADAVGGDALLTYVGALYHDIGKMNKPEYFVENQSGGPNKHDKLSPAMSLLVIVGHVKDGIELAREFGLPRTVQHFIESHHGTTLVEYFYHRAMKQAGEGAPGGHEPDTAQIPDEFEYRYPGPKPRTMEAAIVMLSDAIESAARTLAEPTPSRIDALVRAMANKRLMDGQFDDCEMTLRDLNVIVESIGKSLVAIYHGRISYQPVEVEQKRA